MTRILPAFKFLKRLGFAVLFNWGASHALAQPDTIWTRQIGAAASDEQLSGIVGDALGGLLMVGSIRDSSFGTTDGLINSVSLQPKWHKMRYCFKV
jgi:hypothetical protein